MARHKETIWQADFLLGAIREEAVERDDVDIIHRSVKNTSNTVVLSTGQIKSRPGTVFLNEVESSNTFEIDLGEGLAFDLVIEETGLTLYNPDGSVEATHVFSGIDWTTQPDRWLGGGSPSFGEMEFWVIADSDTDTIIIGSKYFPPKQFQFNGVSWSFSDFEFFTAANGEYHVPFWRFYPGVEIQPSERDGDGFITVTASAGIWDASHVGAYIRYGDRQLRLEGFTSSTVMTATVIQKLPPTKVITVDVASEFQVGEAVEDDINGGQGVITEIAGNELTVFVTSNFSGFVDSGDLIGPNAKASITAVDDADFLASTVLWDMALWNQKHGYPGWAVMHGSRLMFCDLPSTPLAFAASAAQDISSFKMGALDGDGFVEVVGTERGGALKHMVSAEDLLFMTTKGIYYHESRDGSVLTPLTIAPKRFSRFGASPVRPVSVDDGCIFIDAVGKRVHAAVLAGDVYKQWRVIPLTKYSRDFVDDPVVIGATSSGSESAEHRIFVVNGDGTSAVCQWDRDENVVSWRDWNTQGSFLQIYQSSNGAVAALVRRRVNGVNRIFRERFEEEAMLDCLLPVRVAGGVASVGGQEVLGVTPAYATHLSGKTVAVFFDGWDLGDFGVNSSGVPVAVSTPISYPSTHDGNAQVGLNFEASVTPWSRRSVQTQRGIREVKRLISMFVSVQTTTLFDVDGETFGGYRFGEDVTLPPENRSEQVKASFIGAAPYEEKVIAKLRPGPFLLLKVGYRVMI